MGWLGNILKAAAPVAGFALGGPLGGMIGGGISSAIGGAERGSKADKLTDQRLRMANERFAAGKPFRDRLGILASRGQPQREDLSALVADRGNPYARVAPRPMAPMAPQAPQMPPGATFPPQPPPGPEAALMQRRRPPGGSRDLLGIGQRQMGGYQ